MSRPGQPCAVVRTLFNKTCTKPMATVVLLTVMAYAAPSAVAADANGSAPAPPGRIHHTYPQPPRAKPSDPLHVNPGYDVPDHPERYVWKLTSKGPNGKPDARPTLPVYSFNGPRRVRIGELPVGTEVKLDTMRSSNGHYYYAVVLPGATPAKDAGALTWVDGLAIDPVSYTPVVQ